MKLERAVATTVNLKVTTVIAIMVVEFLVVACVASVAANSQVYGSLQRSRDALLDQRNYLQGEANRLAVRISALQTQLDTVNSYLRDNDRALRDVETAMNRAQ
ncbi:MAG: hypothetical protein QG574_856 [Cyanobacteriota bacterium erpe_2018_sw_21hr_WHONDRS-SW48-000092_B_bin.40]|jgi:uncharacterized protein YlxW (UPF0749 family)|nr:hypothetical protein [Cyanobacteriota bacterium erpe_2018_sw_21hr_WHONDRS-SW48-000092_B_bin.40]